MTIDDELYLRTFMNDLGSAPAKAALVEHADTFNLVNQSTAVLSAAPNASYTPLIYFNSVLQQDPEFYTISGSTVTLVALKTGTLLVRYWV